MRHSYTWHLDEVAAKLLLPDADEIKVHKAKADAENGTLWLTYSVEKESENTNDRKN